MATVDSYIPEPERDTDKPLLLPVEDVFSITGRGTVASGRIDRGTVRVNDEIEIVGIKEETQKAIVTGVEMFRKQLDEGLAGDNVGILLRGVQRDEIERGQVIAKPVQSTHILNLKVKYTSFLKKKVDVILHSSTTTAHNSTSVQLT